MVRAPQFSERPGKGVEREHTLHTLGRKAIQDCNIWCSRVWSTLNLPVLKDGLAFVEEEQTVVDLGFPADVAQLCRIKMTRG